MKHYTAEVEVTTRGNPTPEEVDRAMEALAGYAPSISVSPHGYRAARITFPADTIAQASSTALAVVATALGGDIVRLELMTEEEADRREGTATLPELVGVTEAADILGVSPQRVRQMIDEGKFAAHRIGGKSYALIRSEVAAKVDRYSVMAVALDLGIDTNRIIANPLVESTVEYRWQTPAGEVIESEEMPPPDAKFIDRREAIRYRFRIAGAHPKGMQHLDGNGVETSFDITRHTAWTTTR